jgi:hypothetical protein
VSNNLHIRALRVELRPAGFSPDGALMTANITTWDDKIITVSEAIELDPTESFFDTIAHIAMARLKRMLKEGSK